MTFGKKGIIVFIFNYFDQHVLSKLQQNWIIRENKKRLLFYCNFSCVQSVTLWWIWLLKSCDLMVAAWNTKLSVSICSFFLFLIFNIKFMFLLVLLVFHINVWRRRRNPIYWDFSSQDDIIDITSHLSHIAMQDLVLASRLRGSHCFSSLSRRVPGNCLWYLKSVWTVFESRKIFEGEL